MRKDIEIHIQTNDVTISPQNTFQLRTFRWVSNPTGLTRYIYGEIDVPSIVTEASIRNNGLYFSIPYTPQYNEFMVRIRRVYENGAYTYVTNLDDGSVWFTVKAGLYGGDNLKNIFASQLLSISENSFYGRIGDNCLELYSSSQSDFNIVAADRQNANCMLACNPSNNYRYPVTGVGLVRWVNSGHINTGNLAEILQREFSEDGVYVKNAQYDYNTKAMEQLELDTSNAE